MEKLLRLDDVIALVQRGATSIYADIKEGRFPEPVRIGRQAVRWRESDLDGWAANLPKGVDATTSAAANQRRRNGSIT